MKSLQVACFFLGLTLLPHSLAAKEPSTDARVDALLAVIKPAPDEDRWAKIDWRTDLWEARKEAAAAGKPILLWEMDGHPLGCV